jgi:hypothetical protein
MISVLSLASAFASVMMFDDGLERSETTAVFSPAMEIDFPTRLSFESAFFTFQAYNKDFAVIWL